jgi:hypothetical protein
MIVATIAGIIGSVVAAYCLNNLWVRWKRDDQEKYQRQPPGGHASGYALIVMTLLVTANATTGLVLWMN